MTRDAPRPRPSRLRILGGAWRGATLLAPAGEACRPTLARVREALFERLGARVADAQVVDLFAGSGALGLEALSRGARRAVFVERSGPALAALRRNIAALGAGDRSRVAACDAEAFLEGRAGPAVDVDLLLADPDYGSWDAAWSARLDRGAGLRWSRGALRVLETSRREPEPMPAPGWRRWPARLYGETRITIEEREVADGADAGM